MTAKPLRLICQPLSGPERKIMISCSDFTSLFSIASDKLGVSSSASTSTASPKVILKVKDEDEGELWEIEESFWSALKPGQQVFAFVKPATRKRSRARSSGNVAAGYASDSNTSTTGEETSRRGRMRSAIDTPRRPKRTTQPPQPPELPIRHRNRTETAVGPTSAAAAEFPQTRLSRPSLDRTESSGQGDSSATRSSKKKWHPKEDTLLWRFINEKIEAANPVCSYEERMAVFEEIIAEHGSTGSISTALSGRTASAIQTRAREAVVTAVEKGQTVSRKMIAFFRVRQSGRRSSTGTNGYASSGGESVPRSRSRTATSRSTRPYSAADDSDPDYSMSGNESERHSNQRPLDAIPSRAGSARRSGQAGRGSVAGSRRLRTPPLDLPPTPERRGHGSIPGPNGQTSMARNEVVNGRDRTDHLDREDPRDRSQSRHRHPLPSRPHTDYPRDERRLSGPPRSSSRLGENGGNAPPQLQPAPSARHQRALPPQSAAFSAHEQVRPSPRPAPVNPFLQAANSRIGSWAASTVNAAPPPSVSISSESSASATTGGNALRRIAPQNQHQYFVSSDNASTGTAEDGTPVKAEDATGTGVAFDPPVSSAYPVAPLPSVDEPDVKPLSDGENIDLGDEELDELDSDGAEDSNAATQSHGRSYEDLSWNEDIPPCDRYPSSEPCEWAVLRYALGPRAKDIVKQVKAAVLASAPSSSKVNVDLNDINYALAAERIVETLREAHQFVPHRFLPAHSKLATKPNWNPAKMYPFVVASAATVAFEVFNTVAPQDWSVRRSSFAVAGYFAAMLEYSKGHPSVETSQPSREKIADSLVNGAMDVFWSLRSAENGSGLLESESEDLCAALILTLPNVVKFSGRSRPMALPVTQGLDTGNEKEVVQYRLMRSLDYLSKLDASVKFLERCSIPLTWGARGIGGLAREALPVVFIGSPPLQKCAGRNQGKKAKRIGVGGCILKKPAPLTIDIDDDTGHVDGSLRMCLDQAKEIQRRVDLILRQSNNNNNSNQGQDRGVHQEEEVQEQEQAGINDFDDAEPMREAVEVGVGGVGGLGQKARQGDEDVEILA